MKYIILIALLLAGCTDKKQESERQSPFVYGARVTAVKGFQKGHSGIIANQCYSRCGEEPSVMVRFEKLVYANQIMFHHACVLESNLELVNESR